MAFLTIAAASAEDSVDNPELTSGGSDSGEYANTLMLKEFTIIGGGYFPTVDSKVRFDSSSGRGTDIDFEDRFGVDESAVTPFAMGRWRINPKHRLEIEYFELNRDGGNAVDGTFQFGNLTIPVGAAIQSESDLGIGRITYAYSFFNDGETELGAAIGAHVATLDVSVALKAGVGGVAGSSTADGFDITAPLPHVGLVGSYAFTPELMAEGRLIGFYLKFGEYTGRLLQADLKLMYQIWENVGAGVGLQYFDFNLEKDSGSNFRGKYELDFIGPSVFLTLGF